MKNWNFIFAGFGGQGIVGTPVHGNGEVHVADRNVFGNVRRHIGKTETGDKFPVSDKAVDDAFLKAHVDIRRGHDHRRGAESGSQFT